MLCVGGKKNMLIFLFSLSKEDVWKTDANHCLSKPLFNPAQWNHSEICWKIKFADCKHTQKQILSPTNAIDCLEMNRGFCQAQQRYQGFAARMT